MKFGVREICDVVLRAKAKMNVGSRVFYKDEPVLYFDSLTTSSLEGAATTVYATGGRGNARLLAWEGERTLTFNMTDALISAESFMILSGAGLIDATASKPIYVHTTSKTTVDENYKLIVPDLACWNHKGEMLAANVEETLSTTAAQATQYRYNAGADIFIIPLVNGEAADVPQIPYDKGVSYKLNGKGEKVTEITCYGVAPNSTVLVDYYVRRNSNVKQIEITPDQFGGYFYLEASTLFREEATGRDLPAEFVIPRCKVQSNFTFTMASTGDPSTFDFVLDAFPDYTKFDQTKEVLAILQVVEEEADTDDDSLTAQRHHVAVENKVDPATDANAAEHKATMYTFGDATYAKETDDVASADFKGD